jgi:PleD family two-component response regulator
VACGLGARFRRLKRALRATQRRSERELCLERELQAARAELARLGEIASTDALTGLANRRRLDE